MSAPVRVDARGMRCPWPALRLARAMRGASAVLLIADDPLAPSEVRALADAQGWSVTVAEETETGAIFVQKGTAAL